jgi:hypothetical protein
MRTIIIQPKAIITILILHIIPLLMFPFSSFGLNTQEWWLPVFLAVLTVISVIQLIRGSSASWPWYLMAFAQGFNIISRMMMLLPHAMMNVGGVQVFDGVYVTLSILSMLLSALLLWYNEQPEVRLGLIHS